MTFIMFNGLNQRSHLNFKVTGRAELLFCELNLN